MNKIIKTVCGIAVASTLMSCKTLDLDKFYKLSFASNAYKYLIDYAADTTVCPGTKFTFTVRVDTYQSISMLVNDKVYATTATNYSQYYISYEEIDFVMPQHDVYIEFKVNYLEDTPMPESLSWISNLTNYNVLEVQIQTGHLGVSPDKEYANIVKSNHDSDIRHNVYFLQNMKLVEEYYDIDGGYYTYVTYLTENEQYTLKILNDYVFTGGRYYRLISSYRPSISYPKKEGIKTQSFFANCDYGNFVPNVATLLMGDTLFPDLIRYFVNRPIVAGDYIGLYYTGEIVIKETYPSTFDFSNAEILSVDVEEAQIIEYVMMENPGGGKSLAQTSDHPLPVGGFSTQIAINEDGSFGKYMDLLPIGSYAYGIIPPGSVKNKIEYIYTYNPRP